MTAEPQFVMTNLRTFLAIAKESLATSEELSARQRRPGPGGGEIISFDPDQRSFKHSLIAIVFAGVYLEALLYLHGCRLLGKAAYKKIDRKTYEEKFVVYGISDPDLLAAAREFREARNELVHEKAHEDTKYRTAQEEARKAVALVDRVTLALRGNSERGS